MANLKMKLAAALNRANGPEPKLKKSSISINKSNATLLSNPLARKSNMRLTTPTIKKPGSSSYTPSTTSTSSAVNNVTTPTSVPQKTAREKRKEMKSDYNYMSGDKKQENKLKKLESKLENKKVIRAARDKKKADIISGERERGITNKVIAGTGAAAGLLTLAEQARKAFSKKKDEE
jgi:hypothetical protein